MFSEQDDPTTLRMYVKDRSGISEITVEGANFLEVKKRFLSYLEYIYQDEKYVSITIEVVSKFSKIKRVFERISYSDAREKIIDFLRYVYNFEPIDEEYYYKYPEHEYYDEIRDIKEEDVREIKRDLKNEIKDTTQATEFAPWLKKYNLKNLSIKDKVLLLLKHNHPNEWVRSQDLKLEYEFIYREKIKLSSLSTYLARFYEEGLLERRGSRAQREYRLISEKANAVKI